MTGGDEQLADIVLDLIRSANLLTKNGRQYAKAGDLSSVQQYMVLAMLSENDNIPLSELRQNTLVSKQSMSGIIHRLEQSGHIAKSFTPQDRRVTRIYLTDKGKCTLATIRPFTTAGNRASFACLSPDEIQQLSFLLQKLVPHLEKDC